MISSGPKDYFKVEGHTFYYKLLCENCGNDFIAKAYNAKKCDQCKSAKKIKNCIICGVEIHTVSKYCCECRPKKEKAHQLKICPVCKVEFISKHSKQKYCSQHCKQKKKHNPIECKRCRNVFVPTSTRQIYCSRTCNRESHRKSHSQRYEKCINKEASISLYRLIKNENNTCYLCNKKCDLYDYSFLENGQIVVGDNYPTIEHVIPIAKGGQHTWDNVKLAHSKCNRRKGMNLIE